MNIKNYKSRWRHEQDTEDEKFEVWGLLFLGALVLAFAVLIANHYNWVLQ